MPHYIYHSSLKLLVYLSFQQLLHYHASIFKFKIHVLKTTMTLISGKRIIDLSRIIAGPYATMVLADFGCQVIKIESPEGDPTRQWGPPWNQGQSTYFTSINRNKKSLALNLKQPKCREILYKLTAKSDVVIQNFIPGVTQKLKVDYETLKQYNKNLVYCSISGFGDIGSKKYFPAFDNLIQAETGFMHLTGQASGDPYKLGFAIADVVTSLYASNAILAGLMYQIQNGEGIHIKTSLFESAVASLINQGSNYLNGSLNPQRMGNHHPNIVPYGLYQTKTLPIIICVGTNHQFQELLKALNLEDRPQFKSNQLRVKNRDQFNEKLNHRLKQITLDEAVTLLQKHKIPCGRVNDLKSLFQGQTAKQLGMVQSIGEKKFVRSPIRTNKDNIAQTTQPPLFNQNGKTILEELGLSQSQIEQITRLSKRP